MISIERASELLCENIPALKRLPAGRATAHLEDVTNDYDDDHDDVIDDNYQFLICSRSNGGGFDGNDIHMRGSSEFGQLALGLRLQLSQTGWPSAHCHIRTCKYFGAEVDADAS